VAREWERRGANFLQDDEAITVAVAVVKCVCVNDPEEHEIPLSSAVERRIIEEEIDRADRFGETNHTVKSLMSGSLR